MGVATSTHQVKTTPFPRVIKPCSSIISLTIPHQTTNHSRKNQLKRVTLSPSINNTIFLPLPRSSKNINNITYIRRKEKMKKKKAASKTDIMEKTQIGIDKSEKGFILSKK